VKQDASPLERGITLTPCSMKPSSSWLSNTLQSWI